MDYQNINNRSGLMNLIAEFVVKLLTENSNTKSNITITDCKSFIVINGQTNSSKILSMNDLKTKFTLEMGSVTKLNDILNFNIIDLIQYKDINEIHFPKKYSFTFFNSEIPRYYQEIINNVKSINEDNYSTITYNENGFLEILSENNSHLTYYQSKFPYGYSLNDWKIIFLYFEYISYNIFSVIKANYLNFKIESDLNFTVESDSMYSNDDIISLIKDVFDFDLKSFEVSLRDSDMIKDCSILNEKFWLKKDRTKECIIF